MPTRADIIKDLHELELAMQKDNLCPRKYVEQVHYLIYKHSNTKDDMSKPTKTKPTLEAELRELVAKWKDIWCFRPQALTLESILTRHRKTKKRRGK